MKYGDQRGQGLVQEKEERRKPPMPQITEELLCSLPEATESVQEMSLTLPQTAFLMQADVKVESKIVLFSSVHA